MATEEYQVGYEAGYQDGWNAAQQPQAEASPEVDEPTPEMVRAGAKYILVGIERDDLSTEIAIASYKAMRRAQPQSSNQSTVEVSTTVQAGQVLSVIEILDMVPKSISARHDSAMLEFARAIEQAVLAKRVPMTDAQIEHALRSEPMVDNEESFALGIRAAERHHGIAGEKEGA